MELRISDLTFERGGRAGAVSLAHTKSGQRNAASEALTINDPMSRSSGRWRAGSAHGELIEKTPCTRRARSSSGITSAPRCRGVRSTTSTTSPTPSAGGGQPPSFDGRGICRPLSSEAGGQLARLPGSTFAMATPCKSDWPNPERFETAGWAGRRS